MFSVLYVDDEPDLLELGKLFLELSPEFHVDIAVSAKEALDSLAIRSFDAIISDFQMPEMDGIAFLKAVRKQYGTVPFILFTGRGREEIVIEAINNGVDFYLQKGGDVRSQFAELSHKIRQSVARRQAELSLIESEKRLTDIINFLPDATFAINRDGFIIAWNRAIEEMTGLSAGMIIGKGDYEYALPFYGERRPILIDMIFKTDEEVSRVYSHIVREGDFLTAETNLPHPRGTRITVLAKASPLYNRQGELVGAIEAIRDITERKKADDELRAAYEKITASEEELREQLDVLAESESRAKESEEKYRELFENAVVGIFRTTLEGKFSAINTKFARIAGYDSPAEMMGAIKDIRTQLYVDQEDRDRFVNALKEEGLVKDFEARYYHRDGHPVWILINAMAVRDIRGAVRYYEGTIEDITEQKKAKEAFQREKTFSDTVIDSIPGLLYHYDSDGHLVRWSKSHESITGYLDEELAGMRLLDWFKGDDEATATITDGVGMALREGQATVEANLLTKSGKRIPFFFTAKRLEIEGKTYFTGVGIDITELRRAQDELRAACGQITASDEELREHLEEFADNQAALRVSEEKFRDIVETSPDLIWDMDAQGIFTYMSPQSTALIGYTPEDVVGNTIFSLVPDDALPPFEEIFSTSVRTKKPPQGFDLPIRRSNGQIITMDIRAVALLGGDDQFKGFRGIARDITTRKAAEKALQEAEKDYRSLVDNSQSIIYTIRPDGIMTFVSPRWTKLLGHASDEVVDPDFRSFVHKDDIPACEALLQKTLETGTTQPGVEYRIFHKDGSIRWHRSNIIPVFDDQNSLISFVGNAVDITESRNLENAFRETNHKLNLLNSITRHDVVNQLTILRGFAQIAAMKKGDPVIADYLQKIITAADIIASQIEFTRAYQELGVKAPAWTTVEAVLGHLESKVPVTFSGTCRGIEIYADPMLERVFFNLFDNAARHGGRVKEITVRCEREPDSLLVIVEDDGKGIPGEEKEEIFRRGVGKNTGLGLFLVREILSITGITIRETGIYGKGARFEISIPEGMYRFLRTP